MRARCRSVVLLSLTLAAACGGPEEGDVGALESATYSSGSLATIRLDAARYAPNGTVQITVTDADANRSSGALDAVSVTVTSTVSTYGEKVTLRETGLATGVFQGAIALKSGAQVKANGVLEVKAGDTVTAAYKDYYDSDHYRTVKATATVDTLPDLSVTALAAGISSAGIAVADTVANAGPNAAPASKVGFYLSRDAVKDAADLLLCTRPTPSLAAGAASSATTTCATPAGASGTYYVIAVADPDGAVTELSETNNARTGNALSVPAPPPPPPPAPDLFVPQVAGPSTADAGAVVTITDAIANGVGRGDVASTSVAYYLSKDGTLAGAVLLGRRGVGAIAGGATVAGSFTVGLPASVSGTWYWLAVVDPDGALVEANEANNALAGNAVTIFPPGSGLPDVVVDAVSAPAAVAPGATIQVTDTVTALAGSLPPLRVAFYLSTDGVVGGGDELFLDYRTTAALAAGASETATTTLVLPIGVTGTWRVLAVADYDGRLLEANEANNARASAPLAIAAGGAPDLVASSATIGAVSGSFVPLTTVVSNVGTAGAAATSIAYYLSADAVFGGDVACGTAWTDALAAGATATVAGSCVVPPGFPAGSYRIVVVVDPDSFVAESNEANNVLVGPSLAVGP